MGTLRIGAIADIHYERDSCGEREELFTRISAETDVLVICGDLTSYGLKREAEVLAADLQAYVDVPLIVVLGNHDYEDGQAEAIREVIEEAGAFVLDGEAITVEGVGFAGVRGFGGGFDDWAVGAWGEDALKQFVQEGVSEAMKLEEALSRLQTERCVVLTHYAPIRETVEGESPEIFPFLGSSRLEEALEGFEVEVAFHGHAHVGAPAGHTSEDVPVYNVSLPVLEEAYPDRPPFRTFEVET